MKQMLEEIKEYMGQYKMLEPGDRVIAAVSGGADSVCMLSVLAKIAGELPAFIRVVHIHHGLRGAEADRDEAFVKQLCEEFALPFFSVHRDVKAYAAEEGLSIEEAGRHLRYQALVQAAEEWDAEEGRPGGQAAKIAVAHHREDSAETVLFHLLRGSGLKGLSGIRPVNGRMIRPLLQVGRPQILAWLEAEGLGWCEDSTNGSGDYTRNFIRLFLLPQMRERVNARAEEHILQAAGLFAMADQYLSQQAALVWEQAGILEQEEPGFVSARIPLSVWKEQAEVVGQYLLRHMIELTAPGRKDFTSRHMEELRRLADSPVGSRLSLPCGVKAQVGYKELELWCGEKQEKKPVFSMEQLELSVFSLEKGAKIPKNQYTKWFDYDRIKGTLCLRGRQTGDYIMLPGGGRKMVNRLMIDDKIPRQERDAIPILAEENHVLWVVGSRISEYYKITEQTKNVLQVIYHGGERYGR